MNQNNTSESILRISHFVFDKIQFQRIGFKGEGGDLSPAQIGVGIKKLDANQYTVSLTVSVEKENEYEASVTIIGFCEVDDNSPDLQDLLNINAPSILFPYARAELTLITAQPETDPVVLPVINFQAMYENRNKEQQ